MYFETGADSLRGILSPGAYYLRGGLSPGHIVLDAYCLGAGCLRGRLSPGRVVSGAYCLLGRIVSGANYLGADCLRAHCLGADCLRADCLGADCLRADYPGADCLGAPCPPTRVPVEGGHISMEVIPTSCEICTPLQVPSLKIFFCCAGYKVVYNCMIYGKFLLMRYCKMSLNISAVFK